MAQDRLFIREYLKTYLEEVEPMSFYRSIFPLGELENKGERIKGKYNAIAVELLPVASEAIADDKKRNNARRYIVSNGLEELPGLLESENFVIMSPISYIGRSRKSENARMIYAMAIDLDGITQKHYLIDLFHQIEIEFLPKPSYIVWSGTGLHLYYQFEKPIPCFKNIVMQLAEVKKALTKKIWNRYVSELAEKPQIESLFQGFRMVGSTTKGGNRTKAFAMGDKVSVEYLNGFIPEASRMKEYKEYKSSLSLAIAAKKYPDWYERRIVQQQPRGTWRVKEDLYKWWLKQLQEKAVVGHRYYCVMVLAVYAKKCGVSLEQLEQDAYSLVDMLEGLTVDEENHFTREDVLAALEMYNDNYITFPVNSISALTAIPIEKNKRNHRKQALHLKLARATKAILREAGELKGKEGRPNRKNDVIMWHMMHPEAKPSECVEATGISKNTVYKYWKMGVADL